MSFPRLLYLFLLLPSVIHTGALPITANGQDSGSGAGDPISHVHEFYRPGRATMMLYVLGQVGQPGMWRVEENVDLLDLLSAAGLPALGLDDAGERQHFTLHIYRGPKDNRREIYAERIVRILEEGSVYPELQAGDILMMEQNTRRRASVRIIFESVRTIASLVSLYLLLRRNL